MIRRGEIRWFRFSAPDKKRPVLVLGREDVLPSLSQVPVIPLSTHPGPANLSDRAPKCAIVGGVVTESSEGYELANVVETALAKALVLAAEAKRWDIVMQIADELHGRRVGRLEAPRVTKVFG